MQVRVRNGVCVTGLRSVLLTGCDRADGGRDGGGDGLGFGRYDTDRGADRGGDSGFGLGCEAALDRCGLRRECGECCGSKN